MNLYPITGNLGQDAELKSSGEYHWIDFSVAVRRSKKVNNEWQDETEWISCILWGKRDQLEKRLPRLKRGSGVVVEGIPSANSFINKDGQLIQKIQLRVKSLFTYPKSGGSEPLSSDNPIPSSQPSGFMPEPDTDDDLPF